MIKHTTTANALQSFRVPRALLPLRWLPTVTAMLFVTVTAGATLAATWTGGNGNLNWSDGASWSQDANWHGGVAPGDTRGTDSTTTADATFGTDGGNHLQITIDHNRAIRALRFDSSCYVIGSSTGEALTFVGGSVMGHSGTIDAPLTLTDGWYVQPAAGQTITFNGDITQHLADTSGRKLIEMLNSSGTVVFNGHITGKGHIHINGGTSAGKLILNNTNTIAGGVVMDVTKATVELTHAGSVTNSPIHAQRGGNVIVNAANAITGSSNVYMRDWVSGKTHYTSSIVFNQPNDYTGGTTLNNYSTGTGAELWADNATGSATGNGDVTVNRGVLGGSGFIATDNAHSVIIKDGGRLSPGSAAGKVGTLTITTGNKGLDLSAAVGKTHSKALLFDLTSPTNSDQLKLTSNTVLKIGNAALEFDDFVFTPTQTLAPGAYTLIDTSQAINGTLGANLTGKIGSHGATGTLSLANNNQDLILTVVAPPAP